MRLGRRVTGRLTNCPTSSRRRAGATAPGHCSPRPAVRPSRRPAQSGAAFPGGVPARPLPVLPPPPRAARPAPPAHRPTAEGRAGAGSPGRSPNCAQGAGGHAGAAGGLGAGWVSRGADHTRCPSNPLQRVSTGVRLSTLAYRDLDARGTVIGLRADTTGPRAVRAALGPTTTSASRCRCRRRAGERSRRPEHTSSTAGTAASTAAGKGAGSSRPGSRSAGSTATSTRSNATRRRGAVSRGRHSRGTRKAAGRAPMR